MQKPRGADDMENMMVSVIMPTYNAGNYLKEAVDSVLKQTYSDLELLIVDDHSSSDASWRLVKELTLLDSRISVLRLDKNSGAGVARNVGISRAKGRFIAFLDDDDVWYFNKLEVQVLFLLNESPFVFSSYDLIDENSGRIGCRRVPQTVRYVDLLVHNVVGTLTAVYDTAHFGTVLMPEIRKRQDLGLWLKLLKNQECAFGIRESLGAYRVRAGSISSNKIDAGRYTWKLYREIEEMALHKALYFFVQYASFGLARTLFERYKSRFCWKRS